MSAAALVRLSLMASLTAQASARSETRILARSSRIRGTVVIGIPFEVLHVAFEGGAAVDEDAAVSHWVRHCRGE